MTNDPFSIVGQQAVPPITSPRMLRDHVIICGLGNLGFRIYTQLDAIGIATVIVDRAPDDDFISRVHLGADYLVRDGARHSGVLEKAGIATARWLIASPLPASQHTRRNFSSAIMGKWATRIEVLRRSEWTEQTE